MLGIKKYILKTYPIFQNQYFRIYFWGQLVSYSGNWLQNVAQGWLVLEITHSAYWVGAVYAFPYLIGGFLAPFGGSIADKLNKKTIMYWTQILGMLQSFLLGVLTITHHVNLPIIIMMAVLLGIISTFDLVTRNPFVIEIIEPEHIGSSMALNGAMQTAAMVFGPGLGGFMLAFFGTGWTFIANSITYVPMIIALILIKHIHTKETRKKHPFKMMLSGFKYAAGHAQLLLCLLAGGVFFTAGFSFRAVLPTLTVDILRAGPEILGWLGSAAGFGACLGALIISAKSKERLHMNWYITGGALLNGVALVAASLFINIYLISCFFFLVGLGFTLGQSATRAESQVIIDKKMRGRVMGLSATTLYFGMFLGNYLAGLLADRRGISFSLMISGLVMVLFAALSFLIIPRIYARPNEKYVSFPAID